MPSRSWPDCGVHFVFFPNIKTLRKVPHHTCMMAHMQANPTTVWCLETSMYVLGTWESMVIPTRLLIVFFFYFFIFLILLFFPQRWGGERHVYRPSNLSRQSVQHCLCGCVSWEGFCRKSLPQPWIFTAVTIQLSQRRSSNAKDTRIYFILSPRETIRPSIWI